MLKKCYRSKGLVYPVLGSFLLLLMAESIPGTKYTNVNKESRPVVRIKKSRAISVEQQDRFEKALDEGKKLYNEMDNHGAITKLQEALGLAQTQQQKSDAYFYLSLAYFALSAEGQNAQFLASLHKLIEVDYYKNLDTHLCPKEYLDAYNEIKEGYGILKIQSLPAGADVYLNDSRRSSGITPLTVAVLAGDVKIEVRKGGKKKKDTVRVAAGTQTGPPPYELKGGSSTIFIVGGVLLAGGLGAALALGGGGDNGGGNGGGGTPPPPTTGTLQINSTPTGAQVFLDGQDRGVTTNTTLSSISAGTHEIVLIKQGYRDYVAQVSITASQTTTHDASLNKHVIAIDQPQQDSEWASGTGMEILWHMADPAQTRSMAPVLKSTSSALTSLRGLNLLRTGSQNISTSSSSVRSRSTRASGAATRTIRTRLSPLARTPSLTRRIPNPGAVAGLTRNPVSPQPRMQTLDKAKVMALETVKIEILLAGQPYQTLVDATENDGSFGWEIPQNFPAGNDYRIRISSVDSPDVFYNSGKFSISNPADITSPANLKATVRAAAPVGSLRYAVDLSWRDRSDNEKGFRIERMDTVNTAWKVVKTVSANTTTYTDTGLIGDRTYSYRVYAYNDDGKSDNSNEVELHVIDYPTNLAIASLAGPAAGLSWKDNSSIETGFQIYRKTDAGSWVLLASVGANTQTYADNTVSSPHIFSYRIRAYKTVSGGTVYSEYSNTGSVEFK